MSRIEKVLVPLKEFNKPLLELKGNSTWIVDRLEATKKATRLAEESFRDELHMPGLSKKAVKAVKANIAGKSANVRKLNELIRHEKALTYEEQLKQAEGLKNAYANDPQSAEFAKGIADFFHGLYA